MSEMAESQYLSVIRVWAAMAWADGVIADQERIAIGKLISVAELSDEERAVAHGFLESKVELNLEAMEGFSEQAREGIYRAALRMAMVDLKVDETETDLLSRIREGLSISEERAAAIKDSVSEN